MESIIIKEIEMMLELPLYERQKKRISKTY